MKFPRLFMAIVATLLLAPTMTLVSAQSEADDVQEAMSNAEESYQRAYVPVETGNATPESSSGLLPGVASMILVMGDENEAKALYNLLAGLSEDDEGYTYEEIDDLGDEAVLVGEPTPDLTENILMAREGNTIVLAIARSNGPDVETLTDIVRHILEADPADGEAVVDGEGVVTGGWADAFPEPDEIGGLNGFEASPVTVFEFPQIPEVATPARISPMEVETPVAEESGTGISMSYTQSYIDMSEGALDSDTRPEIVLTMVMEFDSEDAAVMAFDELSAPSEDGAEFTATELDDLGDEALLTESTDEGGDHGAWVIVRVGNVVLTDFVTGAPADTEIAPTIIRHMLEEGPSSTAVEVDENGVVTGGWANAFPNPGDVEGLENFEPAPVTEMPDESEPVEASTPSA